MIHFKEYKKQKKERLLKKIKEKMKTNIELSGVSAPSSTVGLKDLLDSMAGKTTRYVLKKIF